MANPLTFQEKLKMAEIYKEAELSAPNPKNFNKYRSAWHRKK